MIMEKKYNIRLIGTDLDNTLLTTDKRLTPRTKERIEECLERGIHFLPTTGRARTGIPEFLREIKGLRYVLLANGAEVIDLKEDRSIYQNLIPYEKARELVIKLKEYPAYFDFFADGKGHSESRFYDNLTDFGMDPFLIDLIHMSRERVDSMEGWLDENKSPVEKFTLFFKRTEDWSSAKEELEKDPEICITNSLTNNLEINHHSCNKGDALLALGSHLGIMPEEIMACGDGSNDYEMIRRAGLGVAMANACPEVLEVADYITSSCDEEGVARAIEQFVL